MSLDPIAVDDIVEIKVVCYCRDQVAMNVLHARCTALAVVPPTYAKVAEAIEANLAADYKAAINQEAEFLGVSVRSVFPAPLGLEVASNILAGPGTGAGDILPLQVTGVITKRTIAPGAANRGRLYVPFPSESDNAVQGRPSAGYLVKLDNIKITLSSTIKVPPVVGLTTLEYIVFRRADPAASRIITAYTVQGRFATQRRRGSYGSSNPRPF